MTEAIVIAVVAIACSYGINSICLFTVQRGEKYAKRLTINPNGVR